MPKRSEVQTKSHNENFCSGGKSETMTLSQNLLWEVTPWSLPTVLAICCVEQNFSVHITTFCSEQWGACINIPCPPYLWVFVLTHAQTRTHMCRQHTGAVCGSLVAAVLLLRGSKYCRDAGVRVGRGEEPDLQRDPPALSPRPAGSWVHSCCPGTGLSAVAMGSSVIEPPPPRTENRCIKGHQRRAN